MLDALRTKLVRQSQEVQDRVIPVQGDIDEFLDSFPSVSREQAVAALELAREMTEAHAAAPR